MVSIRNWSTIDGVFFSFFLSFSDYVCFNTFDLRYCNEDSSPGIVFSSSLRKEQLVAHTRRTVDAHEVMYSVKKRRDSMPKIPCVDIGSRTKLLSERNPLP